MTGRAQDFARDLTSIVEASAHALTALNRVLELQQRYILELASAGGAAAATAPSTAAMTGGGPAAGASPAVTTASASAPGELLADAEKLARGLIERSPEVALAHIYQASAHAVGLALLNTVGAQQQLNVIAQTLVTVVAKVVIDRRAAG